MRTTHLLRAAVCACVLTSPAFAGEILFKNGDRLTGTVTTAADGKLTINSPIAGTLTVPLSEVKTFTSDEPVTLKLKDGTVLTQPVASSPTAGAVETRPAAGAVVAPTTVPLEEVLTINPNTKKWSGSIRAGALVTAGNSQTQSVNFGADATRRDEHDRLTLKGEYLFGRQRDNDTGDKDTTVDSWAASAKYDYFFTKKFYGYGLMRAEHDRIADLNLRLAPSVGAGYQWHESAKWNFNTEAGIGYIYEDYNTRESDDFVAARLAYHYDRKLFDNLAFIHNFEYLPSLEDVNKFLVNADVGVRTHFTKSLFAEFKFEWRYNSEPAPDRSEHDFRYILSAGYQF